MKNFNLKLLSIAALYLLFGVFFLIPVNSADEYPEPTIPTFIIYGYGEGPISEYIYGDVGIYNPPVNPAENPNVGQKMCHLETSFTFPKDIIQIESIESDGSAIRDYSNETGVVNFTADLNPCTTIVWLDLMQITFKSKALGTGTVRLTKSVVIGGEDGVTTLSSGTYMDIPVTIVPLEEYYPPDEPYDYPTPNVPPSVPKPNLVPTNRNTTKSTSSASTKTANQTEDSTFKVPALTKLEFEPNAELDKQTQKSKGVVFTGTADPGMKINVLINSDSQVFDSTTSNADGVWSYTLNSWIEDGQHQITAWSQKDNKISKKFVSDFVVSSYGRDQIAIGNTYPDASSDQIEGGEFTPPATRSEKLRDILKNKFFWIYAGVGVVLAVVLIVIMIKKRKSQKDTDHKSDISGPNINSEEDDLMKDLIPRSLSDESSPPPPTPPNPGDVNKK